MARQPVRRRRNRGAAARQSGGVRAPAVGQAESPPVRQSAEWIPRGKPVPRRAEGDLASRRQTARRSDGAEFRLDLREPMDIQGVHLALGRWVADHPRCLSVELSLDGEQWWIASEDSAYQPATRVHTVTSVPSPVAARPADSRQTRTRAELEDLLLVPCRSHECRSDHENKRAARFSEVDQERQSDETLEHHEDSNDDNPD